MKKLVVMMCVVSLAAGAAFAQADPDPDSFGVYFDMGATLTGSAPGYMGYYDAYVMLTNPSAAAGVAGIEFRLTMSNGGAAPAAVALAFNGDGLSPLTAPDYAWGFAAPLPNTPIVLIATHAGATFGTVQEFFVGPIESANPSVAGAMVYVDAADAGHKIVMNPSSGSFDLPVAVFNCEDCVTPTSEETWGNVKAMYR